MHFNVVSAIEVRLEDADNFRAFKVVVTWPEADIDTVRAALAKIARVPDQDTAWVSEQALRHWPGRADNSDWQAGITAMIAKAKPHGWIDESNNIRAHIEWASSLRRAPG
ncbi:MAG: hypothetical protein ACJ8F3_15960 [Xanthobacteraceae bacterium]